MSVDFSDKNSKAKGFGGNPSKPNAAQAHEPATTEASEHALQFMGAAQGNIATQLQQKAGFLQGLDEMLDKAVVAISTAEQDILSGTALERKLAAQRAQYIQPIEDVSVSLEFEALNTLEVFAKPASFPSVADTIKAIGPAGKKQLDAAVLGSD